MKYKDMLLNTPLFNYKTADKIAYYTLQLQLARYGKDIEVTVHVPGQWYNKLQ